MNRAEKIISKKWSKEMRKFLVDRKLPKNYQFYMVMDYLVPAPQGYVGI